MPFIINPSRGGRRLALTICALTLALAPQAHAAATVASTTCVGQSFRQTFQPWNDRGTYTLSPGADMEGDLAGWTLAGGAAQTAGNEPFQLGGALDDESLALPAGSSATSRPICVGINYPFMRFFARNADGARGALEVEVLYLNPGGHVMATLSLGQLLGSQAWAPTRRVSLAIGRTGAAQAGVGAVAFRFTPRGGHWQIDDVYVDPYARR
jgi:hypothetical protein